MPTRSRPRPPITAESFRPERVDESGHPDRLITGDAPPSSDPATPPPAPPAPPEPAPATPPPAVAGGAPPAPSAASASPTPPPEEAAGITTAQILAALGERIPVAHLTREPSPYLEAGGRISERFGFFSDLYAAGTRGDAEAGRRAAQFQDQLRNYITAASNDSTSGADLIPPAWGGSWAVDQIQQLRPAVGAFGSANITDNRPFPVPAFLDTTPSALVGDHVEGQPDPAGVVNFEQIMVTPKAKSGRAELSRELLDASPALADQMVSGALRESYAQITESTMAGVLAAAATPGPAGGADAVAVEKAIRTALGLLPGTRFLPGRVILPSSSVWGALVGADGTDGRPLFPYLLNGPTNAAGTTATGYASGNIAGVETRPTWGLGAGETIIGAGPNDAMSFESSLLEFRFAEKKGPELVEFNVWGYFAAVVLQRKGVILITSTAGADDAGEMVLAGPSNGERGRNGENGENGEHTRGDATSSRRSSK